MTPWPTFATAGVAAAPAFAFSVVKVAALLLLAWGGLRLLRRRSANLRHRLITLVFLAALTLPLVATFAPTVPIVPVPAFGDRFASAPRDLADGGAMRVEGSPKTSGENFSAEPQSTGPTGSTGTLSPTLSHAPSKSSQLFPGLSQTLAAVWCLVAAALLFRLLWQVAVIRRLARKSKKLEDPPWLNDAQRLEQDLGIRRSVEYRIGGTIPMVWGVSRPVILLPADAPRWSQRRRLAVLAHELAHVKHADVSRLLLARLACALYWFHPMSWLLHKRQVMDRELACDGVVLERIGRHGLNAAEYADELLAMARAYTNTRQLAPVMAEKRNIEGRIMAILNRRPTPTFHAGLERLVFGLSLTGLIALASMGLASTNPTLGPSAGSSPSPSPSLHQPSLSTLPPAAASAVAKSTARRTVAAVVERYKDEDSDIYQFKSALSESGIDTSSVDELVDCVYGAIDVRKKRACVWALGSTGEPAGAATLIDVLSDTDPLVRQWAARGLAHVGDSDATLSLVASLDDEDAEARQWKVRTLGQIGDERAASALLNASNDPDDEVREWVARSLPHIGGPDAGNALRGMLVDPDDQVREWAIRGLLALGSASSDDLALVLEDERDEVREWALRASDSVSPSVAREIYLSRLQDESASVREWAVRGLERFGSAGTNTNWRNTGEPEPLMPYTDRGPRSPADSEIIGELIRATDDPSPAVREWAVRVLGEVGDASAVSALINRTDDENNQVQEFALRSLALMDDDRAVEPHLAKIDDPAANIREWAVRGLGALQDPRMFEPVAARTSDSNDEVREWAARVLGAYGDPAARPYLESLLADPDDEVRRWAGVALENLR